MKYVCDAGALTWFQIESQAEAQTESQLMDHAVDRYFREAREAAARTFTPPAGARLIEQKIGLEEHILRTMPHFLTLRDRDGTALVTAMLDFKRQPANRTLARAIIVGRANTNPYPSHRSAITALGAHYGATLDERSCYPYRG
ncbi:MAG: hypothetical protein ACFCUN_11965 [Hyphomicrobiaceae bacterium]